MIARIVVINDLSHAKGGASQLALESARAFAARGYRVTLLCGSGGNAELTAEGIEVVALGHDRLLSVNPAVAMLRGVYNRPAREMVESWIAAHDTPDTVYHVHGWSQILSPSLFDALLPVRERTVMHAHDFFLTCPNGAMFQFPKAIVCPLVPMSAACVTSNCDRRGRLAKAWRVVRQGTQDRAMARGELPPQLLIHRGMAPLLARGGIATHDMVVLPNPVVPFVYERIPAEANREVLFVGRIEATKGIDLAAEACRRAGLRLVAAGDGELLGDLTTRYPEMTWAGRQDRAGLARLARTARLLVMPSRHVEPYGLSAVEALWSGLPVVLSGQSLIAPDIVAAGAGRAIDPLDVDLFAKVLGEIAGDDALTRRMSIAALEETRGLALDPDAWIDALLAAYEARLEGGTSALHRAAAAWSRPSARSSATLPHMPPDRLPAAVNGAS